MRKPKQTCEALILKEGLNSTGPYIGYDDGDDEQDQSINKDRLISSTCH